MVKPTPEIVTLFREGMQVLGEIEYAGIRIDENRLEKAIDSTKAKIKSLKSNLESDDLYKVWKRKFGMRAKLTSRDQLAWLVYDHLKFEPKYLTEKGKPSTEEAAFEDIDLPFLSKYFESQKLSKLLNTYLLNVLQQVSGGYLRAFYNLHTTVTGRSSSDSPNQQNIPVRSEVIGKLIRDCFVPRKGRVLVESDYGAMEFQISCAFWKDQGMIEYASNPSLDIHRDFTAEVYGCELDQVSKMMRSIGKNQFVFPILYGSYYISCAKNLWASISKFDLKLKDNTSPKDHLASKGIKSLGLCDPKYRPKPNTFEHLVKQAEDKFFNKFPTFAEKKEKWWNSYLKKGGFRMPTGFACNGEYSRNFLMNACIQGSAFHCLLQSLVWLHNWLKSNKKKSLIVAQIHDCILKDCLVNEVQDVLNATEYFMSKKIRDHWKWICVPLKVEVDVTPIDGSWAEKAPWIKKDGIWQPK